MDRVEKGDPFGFTNTKKGAVGHECAATLTKNPALKGLVEPEGIINSEQQQRNVISMLRGSAEARRYSWMAKTMYFQYRPHQRRYHFKVALVAKTMCCA